MSRLDQKFPKWWGRLDSAKERGSFTETDFRESGPWRTCAIGERREVLEKLGVKFNGINSFAPNSPNNERLMALGGNFWSAVTTNRFDRVEEILTAMDSEICKLENANKNKEQST